MTGTGITSGRAVLAGGLWESPLCAIHHVLYDHCVRMVYQLPPQRCIELLGSQSLCGSQRLLLPSRAWLAGLICIGLGREAWDNF